jgi:hypothetical protein
MGDYLNRILGDVAVGGLSTVGAIELTIHSIEKAQSWGPIVEKHMGPVGRGLVEHGYPVLVAVLGLYLICRTVEAFDQYHWGLSNTEQQVTAQQD